MPLIDIVTMRGMIPRVAGQLLPDDAAALAQDCTFERGIITPLRDDLGVAFSDDLGVSWSLLPRMLYSGLAAITVDIVLNEVVRILSFRQWPEEIDELVRAIGTDVAVPNHYMKIA